MKTKYHKFCLLFVVIILFCSCNRNNKNANIEIENTADNENEIIEILQINYPIEEMRNYGYISITNILVNNVDARNYPSFEAEIIYTLHENDIVWIQGFSNDGKWVNVISQERRLGHGWILIEYINIGDIEPSPIKLVEFSRWDIKFSYEIKGEKIYREMSFDNNLIVWGPYSHGYHYSNIPGVYILDRDTQELIHITHLGGFTDANAWSSFMGDFEYLVQDVGTGMSRGLIIWRLRDGARVFQGGYDGRWFINNHTIQYIYTYSDWNIGSLDEEIRSYARAFMEDNPPSEGEPGGLFVTLIIRCSLDLETGERNILGAEYILTE